MNYLKLKLYRSFPTIFSKGIEKLIDEYHHKKGDNAENSNVEEITILERLLMKGTNKNFLKVLEHHDCRLNFKNYTPHEILVNKEIVDYVIKRDTEQIIYLPEEMITDEYLERYVNYLRANVYFYFSRMELPLSEKIRDAFLKFLEEKVTWYSFFEILKNNLSDKDLVQIIIEIGKRKNYFNVSMSTVDDSFKEHKDIVEAFVEGNIVNIEYVKKEFFDEICDGLVDKILKGNFTEWDFYKISNSMFWSSPKILKAILKSSNQELLQFVSKFDISLFSEEDIAELCIAEYNLHTNKDCFPDGYSSSPKFLRAVFEQEYFDKVAYFEESAYTEENKEFLREKLLKESFTWVGNFYRYSSILRKDPVFSHLYLEKVNEFVDTCLNSPGENQFIVQFILRSISCFELSCFGENDLEFLYHILEKYSFDGKLNLHRSFKSSLDVFNHFIDYKIFDSLNIFDSNVFTTDMINKLYRNLPFEQFKNLNFTKEHYDSVYQELIFDSEEILMEKFQSIDSIASAMILVCKYIKSGFKSEKLEQLKKEALIYVDQKLKEISKDTNSIEVLIQKVLDGRLNPFWLDYLEKEKQLYVMAHFEVEFHISVMEYIQTIPNEVVYKVNKKHLNQIIKLLYQHSISNVEVLHLAINMYLSIGLSRSKDLLNMNSNKNYGFISENALSCIFSEINPIHVLFEESGNGYLPVYNEQWIHLIFGENYKIKNTPIRNYLGNLKDKREEIDRLKQNVLQDLSLIQSEREEKIALLEEQFHQYDKDLHKFFVLCGKSFNEWDIIEEEFFKAENKSKLKIKLNISKIIEILKLINIKRNMPELEPRDDVLLNTDVFNYVGYDTQYTLNPEKAPARVVELSRKMDEICAKKFPFIYLEKNGYILKVYGPQDRRILSAGYRTGCCFRPNGNADDFGKNYSLFTYCTTTEYGGGVEICDKNGTTVMFSPLLRNGNVLMLHSIESKCWNDEISDVVYELLDEYAKKCMERSSEVGDDISFVTVTSLHRLNGKHQKIFLPEDKKFRIYDEDKRFKEMYHNLNYSHVVLASREGKIFDDIYYGKVDYSYEYPMDRVDIVSHFSMNIEEKKLVQEMEQLNNSIIAMANDRLEYLQQGNEKMSYELLRKIKQEKKEYLNKYKLLLSGGNHRDVFEEYQKANKVIRYVDTQLGMESAMDMNEVIYGRDWYVMRDSQKNVVANCLESGREQLDKYLEQMKRFGGMNEISMLENGYVK